MTFQRIVVAADESDAGRGAARAALELAVRNGAEVAVLRTVAMPSKSVLAGAGEVAVEARPEVPHVEAERLGRWLAPELASFEHSPRVILAITYGVPSIEICRYAEEL